MIDLSEVTSSREAREEIEEIISAVEVRGKITGYDVPNSLLRYAASIGVISANQAETRIRLDQRYHSCAQLYAVYPEVVRRWVALHRLGAV